MYPVSEIVIQQMQKYSVSRKGTEKQPRQLLDARYQKTHVYTRVCVCTRARSCAHTRAHTHVDMLLQQLFVVMLIATDTIIVHYSGNICQTFCNDEKIYQTLVARLALQTANGDFSKMIMCLFSL